jgi:hypothetical protein
MLIEEVPADRFVFIHSEFDQPFKSAASFGNRVRKWWRRDAGLPEGLSAHGMRKAATHWWLRPLQNPAVASTSRGTNVARMNKRPLRRGPEITI